jgi:hypothetical protein
MRRVGAYWTVSQPGGEPRSSRGDAELLALPKGTLRVRGRRVIESLAKPNADYMLCGPLFDNVANEAVHQSSRVIETNSARRHHSNSIGHARASCTYPFSYSSFCLLR